MKKENYMPHKAEIIDIIQETGRNLNIKTYHLRLKDDDKNVLEFEPGQFLMLTAYGVGEAPYGFASSPENDEYIKISVKKMGKVTTALHNMKEGDIVGVRGPYGNNFPVKKAEGKNIVFVGGGIGVAPLRSLMEYVLDPQHRDRFGEIQMLHGFRSPDDMLYTYDHRRWEDAPDTLVKFTIDEHCEGWDGCVGFPHNLLADELECTTEETVYFTCGPPIMIKAVIDRLTEFGVEPENIITTLEMRMSCGMGKCGKCNIGHRYVCKDGPVFTYDELKEMPDEY